MFDKIHTKPKFLSKTNILTLLKLPTPIKTDRTSIVDLDSLNITSVHAKPRSKILDVTKPILNDSSWIVEFGSLDITSVSLLGWSFMPKRSPRALILDTWSMIHDPRFMILDTWFLIHGPCAMIHDPWWESSAPRMSLQSGSDPVQ